MILAELQGPIGAIVPRSRLPCNGMLTQQGRYIFLQVRIDSSGKQEKIFTRLVSLKEMRFWNK